jgi:hypothetical protein
MFRLESRLIWKAHRNKPVKPQEPKSAAQDGSRPATIDKAVWLPMFGQFVDWGQRRIDVQSVLFQGPKGAFVKTLNHRQGKSACRRSRIPEGRWWRWLNSSSEVFLQAATLFGGILSKIGGLALTPRDGPMGSLKSQGDAFCLAGSTKSGSLRPQNGGQRDLGPWRFLTH